MRDRRSQRWAKREKEKKGGWLTLSPHSSFARLATALSLTHSKDRPPLKSPVIQAHLPSSPAAPDPPIAYKVAYPQSSASLVSGSQNTQVIDVTGP